MPKADPFVTHVTKAAKSADTEALGPALAALVRARLAKRQRTTQRVPSGTTYGKPPIQTGGNASSGTGTASTGTTRRRARRLGSLRFYTATTKPDISRSGTFRKYMISTIRAHTNTRSANTVHAQCDNPAFAKNRLDFNWAADNGFITWN